MKPKLLFTITGAFYVLIGLLAMLLPTASWSGTGTPPLDYIQLSLAFGAYVVALGIMLWLARNADASPARDAIIIGAIVANVLDALGNIVGLILGYSIVASTVVLIINIVLALAFFLAARREMSNQVTSLSGQ